MMSSITLTDSVASGESSRVRGAAVGVEWGFGTPGYETARHRLVAFVGRLSDAEPERLDEFFRYGMWG